MVHDARTARPKGSCAGKPRIAWPGGTEAEYLIFRYKRLVWATARRFFPRHRLDEDLLQCGLIGLWEATRTWSGEGDFADYAGYSILNNMKDYIRTAYKPPPPACRRGREGKGSWEDKIIDRLDMLTLIRESWPANSRERYVLLALLAGVSKHSIAAALGVELHTVRRIAGKAMEGLKKDRDI